ncbi:MAG: CpaF family protein [Robiginitomaculum sp.]
MSPPTPSRASNSHISGVHDKTLITDVDFLGRQRPGETQAASAPTPSQTEAQKFAKTQISAALMESVDFAVVSNMPIGQARLEISEIVAEIIMIRGLRLSIAEQAAIVSDICDDLFGFGPLEPLLARGDIGDIMVNGPHDIFIELAGKIEKTDIKFRDDKHLLDICQRMVAKVGRSVDARNPACDARLEDGSRINVIIPPLSIHGPVLTVRKFNKERLRLRDLVDFGSISVAGAKLLAIISACQCNIIVSGGTGSGKTTLLNCITAFIDSKERIITLEDAAELQLQQPHVISLETRPANMEGQGAVTMRALMKNCLRMRPERIIVGEVRGPEAMDLLQAMNTGHDGSMGTLHANTPRDALARMEAMICMGPSSLPPASIRQMIASSVDIIVQTSRLRDGSRRITHITEVLGMTGDVVTTQDLLTFSADPPSETANGACNKITGRFISSGIARPGFWDRAVYFGLAEKLTAALEEAGAPKYRPAPVAMKPNT